MLQNAQSNEVEFYVQVVDMDFVLLKNDTSTAWNVIKEKNIILNQFGGSFDNDTVSNLISEPSSALV